MIIKPIIPIWIMAIICIVLILIKRKDKEGFIRKILISVLLFIINLRVMLPSGTTVEIGNNLDVIFVIDDTISMLAEDYDGNKTRIEGVKDACNYILDELAGSKFSVISFDNKSSIMVPFTTDTGIVSDAFSSVQQITDAYARGSSLNTPKDNMEDLLKRSSEKEGRVRILFYISDGEITNDDKLKSFKDLKKYINNGAVMGYGTDDGGMMKVTDIYSGEKNYIDDTSTYPYKKAVSQIDEGNLKKVAKDLGIDYVHMEDKSDIKSKVKEIKSGILSNDGDVTNSYFDIYYLFTIPLALVLIYELINYRRRL